MAVITASARAPRATRGALSPAQHAILALLIGHHKRYAYVAEVLDIDFDELRARAHEAVGLLIGWQPGNAEDGRLIDNALGQLPAGESDTVAVRLRHHDGDRRIDARIAVALDAFMPRALPRTPPVHAVASASRPAPPRPARRSRPGSGLAVAQRTVALLSLGLSSIAAGIVLVISGAH
jgi:hypothetical protein